MPAVLNRKYSEIGQTMEGDVTFSVWFDFEPKVPIPHSRSGALMDYVIFEGSQLAETSAWMHEARVSCVQPLRTPRGLELGYQTTTFTGEEVDIILAQFDNEVVTVNFPWLNVVMNIREIMEQSE